MTTNTKESGFEELFTNGLVNNGFVQKFYSGDNSGDYDRKECIDTNALWNFLESSQPKEVEKLRVNYGESYKTKFLQRLQKEITEKGIITVMRKGVKDRDAHLNLMYFEPNSSLNKDLEELWQKNIFTVTRQLYYSLQNNNSLDMVVLINGLPIITLELKNLLTGQNVKDAMYQYKTDRSSREELFRFERCLVHFAVDTELVYMTTRLEDMKTWFLPFNKGHNEGAGNPPSENGMRTSYMWEEILTKSNLSKIIRDFAQVIVEEKNGKKVRKLIFPRYHQFTVVNKLLQDSKDKGTGQKYLIQHSAGSGKSNSISWLAHQLTSLFANDGVTNVFDSILIITDRRVLDKQLRDNVSGFDHTRGLVEAITDGSKQLKQALESGKRIIITTIQKFPVIVDTIGELKGQKFAIIIDEAHSSTSGETIAKMNDTMSIDDGEEEKTDEDIILDVLQARRMLTNASYFAFTATPKNKTLELFGTKGADGKYTAFHNYTMKQAIEEGFIMDVLSNYTTYKSFYELIITKDKDREYDKKRANRQLKGFVESHDFTIEKKAEIMVDHFYNNVYLKGLVGGKAKAMVVCGSRKSAVKYGFAFKKIINEKNLPLGIIVAFSGDVHLDGTDWNEYNLNNFNSNLIPEEFENGKDGENREYKILICANKYQTGFDQPLLQTMYVDKKLGGVNAVQTLSRLNRVHRDKDSTFVLDFYNSEDDIKNAFSDYYKTTILSEGSDPNKLHDLKDALDSFGVYTDFVVHQFAVDILSGVSVEKLHMTLDSTVEEIKRLPVDQIDDFKDKSKSYVNFYSFVSQIINYDVVEFEELYQFLKILNKKIVGLGSKETYVSQDVLDSIDFESYKNQKMTSNARISLSEDGELEPIPTTLKGSGTDVNKDILEHIISDFNTKFGTNFSSEDKIKKIISDISDEIVGDKRMLDSLQTDRANRKLEFKKLLDEKITVNVDDHLELYNSYYDNVDFQEHVIKYLDKLVTEKLKERV
ncbi:MAG: type I restriction endonuclease [Candidatus Gracilibacteria bacterium]|nr:type I restriction endonuclease [Candidatus Gracilibacteria bacterium]